MARKDKPQRRIDQRAGAISLSNFLIEDFEAAPELEINTIDLLVPSGLAISGTTLAYSAYTPTATIDLAWDPIYDRQIDGFVLQWATTSGFADPVSRTIAGNLYEASIDSLPTDSPLYFRVASRFSYSQSDWSEYVSTTTAADTTVPLPPSGLLYNWSSQTGDLTLAWSNSTSRNFAYVRVRIYDSNGGTLLRDVKSVAGRYVWTLAQQASDTAGAYDPSVYVVLTSFSSSGIASATDLTGTITLATPSAVTATATGAFSAFTVTATATSPDLLVDYRYRIYKDSVLVATIYSASAVLTYTALASGSYQADVTARDALNQLGTPSALTTTVTLQSEDEFVTRLRAGLYYTDSEGTAQATLNELKDNITTSGGPTYSGGAWRWIQGDWNREIRHETTTLALSAPISGYLATSLDATNWLYHYGGTVSGSVWQPTNTTVTEAIAQTSPAILPSGITLINLSSPVQTRFVELNLFGATNVREFYPRTLVQADDIVVENLSAISANLGSITAGTVTGATIRTAATGQRVELTSVSGLRGINSGGVTQVQIKPDTGELFAGPVKLDSNGISVTASGASTVAKAVKWTNSTGSETYASINANQSVVGGITSNNLTITGNEPPGGGDSTIDLTINHNSTFDSITFIPGQVGFDVDLAYFIGDVTIDGATVTIQPGAITREAVTAPTYTNGWTTDSGSPGYYKSADSIVRLRGRVAPGTNNTSAFTLPTGYRPPGISHRFPCIARNTAGAYNIAEVTIGTGGTVTISWTGTGTLANVDLSSIQFRA